MSNNGSGPHHGGNVTPPGGGNPPRGVVPPGGVVPPPGGQGPQMNTPGGVPPVGSMPPGGPAPLGGPTLAAGLAPPPSGPVPGGWGGPVGPPPPPPGGPRPGGVAPEPRPGYLTQVQRTVTSGGGLTVAVVAIVVGLVIGLVAGGGSKNANDAALPGPTVTAVTTVTAPAAVPGSGSATSASSTSSSAAGASAAPGGQASSSAGTSAQSTAPQGVSVTNLTGLTPLSETYVANPTTGPVQIGTTNYPHSIRFTAEGGNTTAPDVVYNVAGWKFFNATIGVPDDATNATGNVMQITFFKDGVTDQLGPALNVSVGQPQTVHLALQGASQLTIQCNPSSATSRNSVEMDVALGDATFSPS